MGKTQRRVALIVNPIAGIGGSVGLKGSDGDRSHRARELGATPQVGSRVQVALEELLRLDEELLWFAARGSMGEHSLGRRGVCPEIIYEPETPSTGLDTQRAAERAVAAGIDLLLFAGGDGTARDILSAVGLAVPVLGIPAGVKMHSAVFALTPRSAGNAARRFLSAGAPAQFCARRAVMDREFMPDGLPASSPMLYGYLKSLQLPSLVQAAKASSGGGGDSAVLGALGALAKELRGFDTVLLGPGATLKALKGELGFEGSLLGVDIFARGRCLVRDAREDQIWDAVQGQRTALALGVIGGQGFLIGRGNQQLSPRILALISRDDIRIVASAQKLVALPASTLYVDSGDDDVDAALAGYLPVITGLRRKTLCKVAASGNAGVEDREP